MKKIAVIGGGIFGPSFCNPFMKQRVGSPPAGKSGSMFLRNDAHKKKPRGFFAAGLLLYTHI